jgi:glycosyltransferase involved in cell wall biosynthesis
VNKKVAIIQNRVYKGGRFQVIGAIIKALNDLGIEPDILTQKAKIKQNEVAKFYGNDLKFSLKEIFFDFRIPFELHIILFNRITRSYLKNYDLIINSNNTSIGLPDDNNIISYVHYPRKDRLVSSKLSIHFPEGKNKNWLNPAHFFLNAAKLAYKMNRKLCDREFVIANSEFTKNAILKNYDTEESQVKVIYPPVSLDKEHYIENKNLEVCSVGRFAADKRQLEQIKIAERLPDFNFHFVGFVKKGEGYFEKCRKYVENRSLKNVYFHPNVEFAEMERILLDANFFIHSLRNEPFGIGTVQAISKGCIPVVHNSGGQKEIVNIPELRYETIEDAISIFNKFKTYESEKLNTFLKGLQNNIKQFDELEFDNKIKEVLKPYLD